MLARDGWDGGFLIPLIFCIVFAFEIGSSGEVNPKTMVKGQWLERPCLKTNVDG